MKTLMIMDATLQAENEVFSCLVHTMCMSIVNLNRSRSCNNGEGGAYMYSAACSCR